MNLDFPQFLKRRRHTDIDLMDAETAKMSQLVFLDVLRLRANLSPKAKLGHAKDNYGREIRVFETSKTSEKLAEIVSTEEPDEFFEFTAEDYYRLLVTKKEDKFLKTRKIREAEESARRSRMTKAVIRVRFPDNHTLEATFHPSEAIQSLVDLLKKAVARPELPFYIYTVPPKKRINETSDDFYSTGFVPGAIVYFSYDLPKDDEAHSGPFLKEDLMSLKGLDLAAETTDPIQPASEAVNVDTSAAIQQHKPAEKKAVKPKWLKM